VGCSKPTVSNEPQPEGPVQEQEPVQEVLTSAEQQEVLGKYYSMLTNNSDLEEITKYIDEYISLLEQDIVDDIVVSLEEYIRVSTPSMEIISNTLMNYYDYASGEICSFLDILDKEAEMIFTDGESINIELNELLNRAIEAENHLDEFMNGKTTQRVKEYYEGYITAAIVGSGNQYVYAEDGSSLIRQDVLDSYNHIIDTYKDSATAEILEIYLDKLTQDSQDMNGMNVLEFYEELPQLISSKI
jgi:hypothetical protein